MKERLQQTLRICKERFANTLAMLKTPEARERIKKNSKIIAGLILIVCIGFSAHTIWQMRQPNNFVSELNNAIAQKNIRAAAKLFNTKSIIEEFVNKFHTVQAYFFHDTDNHREINKDRLILSAQILLIEIIKNKGKSDTEASPENAQKESVKKIQKKSIPIPEYIPFTMPELIPLNLAEILAGNNTFTLQKYQDDIAIISTEFAHPELGITIPIKMLMKRGLISWEITQFANTYSILKLVAKAIQGKKDKAIRDFHATNKIINATLTQYFSPSHCVALMVKDHFSKDVILMVSADITNKGEYTTKETSIRINVLSDQGNFIGTIPGNFARTLSPGSTLVQSWRRALKATQSYAPQLFLTLGLTCTVTPTKIVLEDGQSIALLPKYYLEGL